MYITKERANVTTEFGVDYSCKLNIRYYNLFVQAAKED